MLQRAIPHRSGALAKDDDEARMELLLEGRWDGMKWYASNSDMAVVCFKGIRGAWKAFGRGR
jgi:hypothetical protein